MKVIQLRNRFQFDDDTAFDHYIQKKFTYDNAIVVNSERILLDDI